MIRRIIDKPSGDAGYSQIRGHKQSRRPALRDVYDQDIPVDRCVRTSSLEEMKANTEGPANLIAIQGRTE